MTDTIKTYPKLGRFIMNEVYNILLDHDSHKIPYSELKEIIKTRIARTPFIDKEFAMHKLSHGSSKSYLCTYRWENVLYYYLMQHHKAAFTHFEYWEDKKNGVHDYIALRDDYLLDPKCNYSKKFRIQSDMNYMFDWAQHLNKASEEKYLHLMRAYAHLDDNAVEQLLQETKNCSYLGPEEIKELLQKIKDYYSYLKDRGKMAEWYLTQEKSILCNRKNVKTRGGN
ncbi:MAG: hypothetical protein J6T57_03010 [Alphaproteobacteria bacterium]|nr:hypothetical protein [Alphaproteobacteria bacterium]